MSSRRQRLVGMRSSVWRRDIACGGNPQFSLVRALAALPIGRGEIWSIGVRHDAGCPAFDHGMDRCSCEIVELEARKAA
jgi:hypothetical protein